MAGRDRSPRLLARFAIASFAVLLCCVLTAAASAATLPPEGIFEGCHFDTQMPTCVQRLQVIHQGGFQIVVVGAGDASPSSLASYATTAQSLGMSVMWEIGNPSWWRDPPTSTTMSGSYPGFAALCGCNQNGPLLAFLIHWLSQLPGTYGYYAADDTALAPGDEAGVANYVSQIKQQDPSHLVMIGSADQAQTSSYVGIADAIGTEIYPFTTSPLMPVSANQDQWGGIAQWASGAQQAADGAGKQSAFILQAFSWGDNLSDGETIGACTASDTPMSCYGKLPYPSGAEQLQLRNEVLLHAHPAVILWWSFPGTDGDVTGDTYSIYPSGSDAATRWSGLSAAVQAPYPGTNLTRPASHGLGAHLARAVRISRHRHAVRAKHRHRRRHRRRKLH
ncbi:MAG TPA: hypothetical protein VKR21_11050 [Solirubrobacteraceae bacterium]|nr:hypothetical protein [Solirubrobacteraceae bacterium]